MSNNQAATKADIEELAQLVTAGFNTTHEKVDGLENRMDQDFEHVRQDIRDLRTELRDSVEALQADLATMKEDIEANGRKLVELASREDVDQLRNRLANFESRLAEVEAKLATIG